MAVYARQCLQAFSSGDGKALLPYVWSEEVRANALTAEKITAVCQLAVLPVLQKYGSPNMAVQDNGQSAVAAFELYAANGRPGEVTESVNQSDEGPRTEFLGQVFALWSVDWRLSHNLPFSEATFCSGVVDGWSKYGESLEKLGVKYYVRADPYDGTLSVQPAGEYVAKCRRRLAELNSKG